MGFNVWQQLLNFFYPPTCPCCNKLVEEIGEWCFPCLQREQKVRRLPLTVQQNKYLTDIWALGTYSDTLQKLLKRLKYQQDMTVLPSLHFFIKHTANKVPFMDSLLGEKAVYIPLHHKKLQLRGFNQTELLFIALLKQWQMQKSILLERVKETVPQYRLNRRERASNLRGAFSYVGQERMPKESGLLLLDDVFTTGITMQTAALVLRRAGHRQIYGLALVSNA